MRKIKKYIEFVNESRINADMPIPNDIKLISSEYIKNGKEIFIVGGAVRDFLQGKSPKDYDLVTNALPEESKVILSNFKVSDEQGKKFGVLRVYTKDEPLGYEIASYRKDISKGRNTKGDDPKVEMGTHITIEDDCQRRDLTINALFYDLKNKQIVDIVGGVDDIKNNVIRCVGDPKKRFNEDRLRICRIFRFAARINGKIDDITSKAIKSDNRLRGISNEDDVSPERVWDEIKKSFSQCKDFSIYLKLLVDYNMFDQIFPGLKVNTNIVRSKYLEVYLANILKYNDLPTLRSKLIEDFKIETDMARSIEFLVSLIKFNPDSVTDFYKAKRVSRLSDDVILDWYRVNGMNDKMYMAFLEYRPTVSAQDLMKQGFKDKALGDEIKRLEVEKFKDLY